jgi:hypothetical protein
VWRDRNCHTHNNDEWRRACCGRASRRWRVAAKRQANVLDSLVFVALGGVRAKVREPLWHANTSEIIANTVGPPPTETVPADCPRVSFLQLHQLLTLLSLSHTHTHSRTPLGFFTVSWPAATSLSTDRLIKRRGGRRAATVHHRCVLTPLVCVLKSGHRLARGTTLLSPPLSGPSTRRTTVRVSQNMASALECLPWLRNASARFVADHTTVPTPCSPTLFAVRYS